jgi:hypothetical protein
MKIRKSLIIYNSLTDCAARGISIMNKPIHSKVVTMAALQRLKFDDEELIG